MSESRSKTRPRVLIVEDDRISSTALRKLLTIAGFHASCVATLASAKEEMADDPQFLILDLNLPDGDGTSLLQYAREHHRSTRVAITTATDREAPIASAAKRLQPDAFFRKPLHIAEVIEWMNAPAH